MAYVVITGQIRIPRAGDAVPGPPTGSGTFTFKRHPRNRGKFVVVGENAGVSENNGFVLEGGEQLTMSVSDLSRLWFTADRNGDRVIWVQVSNSERIYASV